MQSQKTIALDNRWYWENIISYFSMKTYAVGTGWQCFNKAILTSTVPTTHFLEK